MDQKNGVCCRKIAEGIECQNVCRSIKLAENEMSEEKMYQFIDFYLPSNLHSIRIPSFIFYDPLHLKIFENFIWIFPPCPFEDVTDFRIFWL